LAAMASLALMALAAMVLLVVMVFGCNGAGTDDGYCDGVVELVLMATLA
jgi:hypothetical protein